MGILRRRSREKFASGVHCNTGRVMRRLALTRCRGRHIMMGYLMNPRLGQEHMEEMKKKNQVVTCIRFVLFFCCPSWWRAN
jgi:hypothetical protein